MFKALLWKEWRALRALRWFGWALVPMLALGAWANAAGWLGRSATSQDLIADVMPALLAFGVWPLLATMCGAQAFAGDRAAGTERFLLERPVRRRTIWAARFGAAALTLFAVAISHVLLWAVLMRFAVRPGEAGGKWQLLAVGFAVFGVLGILGASAAGAMTSSTLAAALGGMMFASAPFGIAYWGTQRAPWARIGDLPFAVFPAILAVFALPLASWAACCFGERSGRGRWWRGIPWLVGGVLLAAAVFLIGAPRVVAAQARGSLHNGDYYASPDGGAGWIAGQEPQRGPEGAGRSWLVDGDVTRTLDFAPEDVAWSPDGTRVAVLLYGDDWFQQVRIYSREGEELERLRNLGSDRVWAGLQWWTERPLVHFFDTVRETRGVVDPWSRSGEPLFEFPKDSPWYALMPSAEDRDEGTRWIATYLLRTESGERPPAEIALHTVSESHGLTTTAERLPGKIPATRYGRDVEMLSPSRRFRLRVSRDDEKRVADMETGDASEPFPPSWAGRWLADERLVALGSRKETRATLYAWNETRGVHVWKDFSDLGNFARLELSPDRRKLLVIGQRVEITERESGPPDVTTLDRWQRLYDLDADTWSVFEIVDFPRGESRVTWASNDALFVAAPGYAGLRPIDGGPSRHLIGRP
ncbi:MAG: ABC transporter permease [Planctomycetota bacterium]|nr:ABC transporter permease [Planctomycetota bacterium]